MRHCPPSQESCNREDHAAKARVLRDLAARADDPATRQAILARAQAHRILAEAATA